MKYFLLLLMAFSSLTYSTASSAPRSAPPIYAGLPESFPLDFLLQQKFVAFAQAPNTFQAPIALDIYFNDQAVSVNDRVTQALVFDEYFFAKLPSGSPIRIGMNAKNMAVWDYPAGAQIVHLITLKTNPLQVFEMRLEQKLPNGQWGFGLYTPTPQGYVLNQYQGTRPDAFSVMLANGQKMNVKLSHLPLHSCRNCHFSMSPSAYQYPNADLAGPCGFAPANTGLVMDWGSRYQQTHREPPFANGLRGRR